MLSGIISSCCQTKKVLIVLFTCLFVWGLLHLPGIFYEVETATFMTYTGDEQSPVNGALHILEEKSLLGLRNHEALYYGPIFAVIALPAVVWDYASLFVSGQIHNASDYKNLIIWNWGGILWKVRIISVITGFLGIIAFYFLLNTKTINPSRNRYLPWLGAFILSSNFFYFEYTSFFRHWIFIVTLLFAQIYSLIKITEDEGRDAKYWIYVALLSLISFGVSYISIFFQAMWIPVLLHHLKDRKYVFWKRFAWYSGALVLGMAMIVWWHPYAFLRMFGWLQSGTMGDVPEIVPKISSYWSYLRVLMNGLFPLWILWLSLVAHVVIVKKAYRIYWFWVPIIVWAVYFAVFGSYSHFESRYVLPLAALFFISFFSLLIYYFEYFFSKPLWRISFIVFLLFTPLFHLMNIALWNYQYLLRASDEKLLIKTLTEKQKENNDFSALVVGGDLLGAPHTKAAYEAYMQSCGRQDARLFEELLLAPYPGTAVPLNVYYSSCQSGAVSKEERKKYDTVVFISRPDVGDFYDRNMSYLWFVEDFRTTYYIAPAPKKFDLP